MGRRTDRHKSKSKKIIVIVIFLMLIVGGVAGAAVFLMGNNKDVAIPEENKGASVTPEVVKSLDLPPKEERENTLFLF